MEHLQSEEPFSSDPYFSTQLTCESANFLVAYRVTQRNCPKWKATTFCIQSKVIEKSTRSQAILTVQIRKNCQLVVHNQEALHFKSIRLYTKRKGPPLKNIRLYTTRKWPPLESIRLYTKRKGPPLKTIRLYTKRKGPPLKTNRLYTTRKRPPLESMLKFLSTIISKVLGRFANLQQKTAHSALIQKDIYVMF